MKEQIHNALKFPQNYIGHFIDIHQCKHQGYFTGHDQRCIECEHSLECEWLNRVAVFSYRHPSIAELLDKLEAGISHVDSYLSRQGHDLPVCDCEACQWLRQAENLVENVNQTVTQ